MQARILNLHSAGTTAAGAGFQDSASSRANLIIYNSAAEAPVAADREAIACRSLKYQVADLWSALLAAGTAAGNSPAAEETAALAAQLDRLEADINDHWHDHTLLAHWTELDDRANQLADDIAALASGGAHPTIQQRTNNI